MKTEFQPGGTATLITDKWLSYISDLGKDEAGRWSYVTLNGTKNRKVMVISAYWDIKIRIQGSYFFCNFTAFIDEKIGNDKELIISIDVNETDAETTDLHKFSHNNDLVDAFKHAHPDITPPSIYQQSNNRLNYIFLTPALLPALLPVGVLPFNVPFLTDHGSLLADFDEEILLQGSINNPIDGTRRNLIANNPICRDRYVEILFDLFNTNNIPNKVRNLHLKITAKSIDIALAIVTYERLDTQITEFMLRAEKKHRKVKRGHLWSLKLVEAARRVRYWKTHKSDSLNKRDASSHLLSLGQSLNIDWTPMSVPNICSKLTTARKSLHKAQPNAAALCDEYLEEMAQIQVKNNKTNIATIIKNIRHEEEVKSSFKILRSISKGQQGGAVSHILMR
eukprot:54421-Ditylum_brightwellii.AAC.1